MKLKKLIEKLEKERSKFVENHGCEPDIFDVCDGDTFSDKQIEFGKVGPHDSGAKACYHLKVVRFRL